MQAIIDIVLPVFALVLTGYLVGRSRRNFHNNLPRVRPSRSKENLAHPATSDALPGLIARNAPIRCACDL